MSSQAKNESLLKDSDSNSDSGLFLSTYSAFINVNDKPCIKSNSPSFQQSRFLSIQSFVAFAGLVTCSQMALGIYGKSVLTSIEKRFGISSAMAGFIASSFNIGNLIFVVAVSKLSSTGHRPRIMAVGSLIIALGGFINFTPHLIYSPYEPYRNISSFPTEEINSELSLKQYPYLYVVLIIGEILQGIGATVLIPLSSSYIDDFASKNNSPLYLGILFLLQNIGPGFGYLIGSWTSSYYVDFDKVSSENILVSSENTDLWIGAWWLGYIIIPVCVVMTALPLFFFPKVMKKRDIDRQSHPSLVSSNGQSLEKPPLNQNAMEKFIGFCVDFAQTVKRLMKNFSFMSIVFGYSGLMFAVGSLTAFMPKYLEVSFSKSSKSANLTFGLAVPPTLCFGLLFGGYVVKKFKWKKYGVLRFIIICGILALLPLFATFFIKCSDTVDEICGHNASYQRNMSESNLTKNVVSEQSCKETECLTASLFFIIFTSICALFAANMVTPIYTVLLRSVKAADKCTAIGFMFLIIRGFGLIPAPIVTGAVIDETCKDWNIENGKRKNCLHYNRDEFRIRYLLLNFLAILLAVVIFLLTYIWLWHRNRRIGVEQPPRKLISTLSKCLSKNEINSPDRIEPVAASV